MQQLANVGVVPILTEGSATSVGQGSGISLTVNVVIATDMQTFVTPIPELALIAGTPQKATDVSIARKGITVIPDWDLTFLAVLVLVLELPGLIIHMQIDAL